MKLVKIAAAVIGGLLVLTVAAALAAAWLFDPNDHKDTLAAEFEQRTGRTLVIERDLAFEYLPWLAVETGGITVGNAPGFSERDFARIDRLAARVELIPLLRGEIRIGTIVLEGLELNLENDAERGGNWVLTAGEPGRVADTAAGADAGRLETLDIDGLHIRDGAVTWRELGTDREYAVSGLAVTTGAYRRGEPVDVEAAFRLTDSAGTAATIETRAVVDYAPNAGLALQDARIELEVSVPDSFAAGGEWRFDAVDWPAGRPLTTSRARFMGWVEAAALGGERRDVAAAWPQAELDPDTGTLSVAELTTSVGGLNARWQLAGNSLLESPRIDGAVAIDAAPVAEAARLLALTLPDGADASALGNVDLSTRFVLNLDPFALELADIQARAFGAALTGEASVSGSEPRIVAAINVPAFAPNDALRALLEPHVPDGVALGAFERLGLSAEIDANPAAGTTALRNLRAELLDATLTGRADIASGGGGLSISGRLASTDIAPGKFDAAFGELVTDTVDRRELGTLSFDAGFRYERSADRLTLDPLELEVFGLSASGTLAADALSTAPVYSGRASVTRFAPRDLMRRFGQTPPETSDPGALGSAEIETRFEVTAERGNFRDLVLRLDDSRITGEFTVLDFENPAYRFALAADTLDADRYLAPPADEAAPGERAAGDLELTGGALDLLSLNGRVEVARLRLAGLAFEQVATRIELGRGSIRLEDAGAELYGGRFDGAFGVDSSGELPKMSLTGRAEGLALAPLITALTGDANLSGTASFDVSLAGSGVTVTDNLRSAAGTMGFTMRDGAIAGFDLGRTLCSAYNATQRLQRPPAADVERTRYELLRGTAEVSGGVAASPDLLARASFMDVTGRGSVDLVEQQLDYELEAKLTDSIDIPRCESMDRLVGDAIPLTLRGTLDEPRIRPDFGEILRRRVEDEIRDRASDSLEKRVRERLRDLL